ncbi:cytochrome P450 [Obba rivulosa]|uniref:Cytochrome P450 n=1 Tax=Obba rivulosa TaxID=1052685 RepID=A0A8E2ATN1_9APHY|nr:cytochrome P450 [Obba rivulosa]
MTMAVPPGLWYIFNRFPGVLAPPAIVYVASILCRNYYRIDIPTWALVPAYVFSLPLALFLAVQWRRFANNRNAARLNAVLPPMVDFKWPGSIDNIRKVVHATKHGYLGEMFIQWSEKYGPMFNSPILFEDRIFTTEPEHIKAILATDFTSFEKGPSFFNQLKTLMGTGVFNSDGEMWKFHRGVARPFFSRDRISHFDIFDRHAEDAIRKMKARLREGHAVDFQDLVSRFTLDSATEFLFGKDVRSLSAPLPYPPHAPGAREKNAAAEAHPANQFAKAFLDAQVATTMRSRFLGAWPLFEFWEDKVARHMASIDAFVDPIVQDALAQRKDKGGEAGEEPGDEETLLGHLINMTEDAQILKDETLNILLAGRDTTAATLTYAMYVLAVHPEILQRLRREVLEKVGPVRRPTYDDIREMKYLRAFINEVLRLYPPVPFNIRTSNKATVWPSKRADGKGYYIPPNVRSPYSVFVMHRRKDLWGPDALKFDPDRFLDERVQKYLTPNPFIFLPFNAGPRICLGQQFAYNEVSFMLVRLLQQFEFVELAPEANPDALPPQSVRESAGRAILSDGQEKVWLKSHLTLYANHGLWVKMRSV